jgi:hypothetical protein
MQFLHTQIKMTLFFFLNPFCLELDWKFWWDFPPKKE